MVSYGFYVTSFIKNWQKHGFPVNKIIWSCTCVCVKNITILFILQYILLNSSYMRECMCNHIWSIPLTRYITSRGSRRTRNAVRHDIYTGVPYWTVCLSRAVCTGQPISILSIITRHSCKRISWHNQNMLYMYEPKQQVYVRCPDANKRTPQDPLAR